MTTDPDNTDPEYHIFWLYIVHLIKALGPKKGGQVLEDTTNMMREAGVWPHVWKSCLTQIYEAYRYAGGHGDLSKASEGVIETLKHAYAQDHIMQLAVEALKTGGATQQHLFDEVEKLKCGGYLPSEFRLIPLHIDPDRFQEELAKLGLEPDEFGATQGCDCLGCTQKRTKAKNIKEHGYDPLEN